ncbi:hypothetical protein CF319_g1539 [Tilletia indica]|nr:hypothetical protein CF319_g1539 [Tilletia indica]
MSSNDAIRFLKQHKNQIIGLLKKAFRWYKKSQGGHSGGGGGGGGGQGQGQGGQGGYGGQQCQQQQQYQQPQQNYGGQQQQGGSWGQGPPGGGGQYYPHAPAPGSYPMPNTVPHQSGVKPNHPNFDDNQVNSHNEQYTQLRNQARSEGDAMARCYDQAHAAFGSGDGARASALSKEGHEHKARMEDLNRQASEWIFKANNADESEGTIDLHGLTVKEAIERTENYVRDARRQGRSQIRVVTGKGLHSRDHVAKIKPAIAKLMQDENLSAQVDPRNAGVIIVDLTGSGSRDADALTRDAARSATGNENDCVIM